MELSELKLEDFAGIDLPTISEVTFRRTYSVGQYATEHIELKKQVKLPDNAPDTVVNLLLAVEEAQLEYTAYVNLLAKGVITESQFKRRKDELNIIIQALAHKCETNGYAVESVLNSLGFEINNE